MKGRPVSHKKKWRSYGHPFGCSFLCYLFSFCQFPVSALLRFATFSSFLVGSILVGLAGVVYITVVRMLEGMFVPLFHDNGTQSLFWGYRMEKFEQKKEWRFRVLPSSSDLTNLKISKNIFKSFK